MHRHHCIHCITPPHILNHMLKHGSPDIREAALASLVTTERLRGKRAVRSLLALPSAPANGARAVYDLRHATALNLARLARGEGSAASTDPTVNRAFDGLGKTREFYSKVLKRNSIDDKGMPLNAYVHYDSKFANAFWDGQQMIFGDGDGLVLSDLTKSLDVIAHELTHGVTDSIAGLEYHGQSGALNESMSDVMGSLVKQYALKQTAEAADWLIGAEVWTPAIRGDALRSMKNPGSAYNNQIVGKDPQPGHMRNYANLPDNARGDFGGVHVNSGIPNKAFYLVASAIGGHAWEAPGTIWYDALQASTPTTRFQDFADLTFLCAGRRYGTGGREQQAVRDGWEGVGITVSRQATIPAQAPSNDDCDTKINGLSSKLDDLTQRVASISGRLDRMPGRRAMG
jgi:Zn-dependent metalloprotease